MRFPAITLWLWLLVFIPVHAVVYLPGNSRSQNRAPLPAELPGMRQNPLHREVIRVNGVKRQLEIFQMKTTLVQIARILKTRFKPLRLDAGNDFILAVFKNGSSTDRWLFISGGEGKPVAAFRMEHERELPAPVWHRDLPPLPAGAKADMVLELPRLNAVCGLFSNAGGDPINMLSSCSARLAAAGWYHAGAEHSPAIGGSGELYFRSSPRRELLWVKFGNSGNGAFFFKKL